MKVEEKTILEPAAFELSYSDYNTSECREVSWNELKKSKPGDVFEVEAAGSGCGRDVDEECAKIVYVDDTGAAVLFYRHMTADTPASEDMGTKEKLMWFSFRK